MKTFKFVIILAILLYNISAFSQDKKDVIEYKYDLSKVMGDTSVTYYGWDFRYLIFIDPKYPEPRDVAYKLLPELKGILENKCGADYMKKNFQKPHFVYDSKTIQSLIKNVDEKKFVDAYRDPLTIDSVRSIIKSYPVTGNGLGIVVISDEMRKYDRIVTAYVTVFSLESKEVLYACKVKGKAGGMGSVASFYGDGVLEIMSLFWKSYKKLFALNGNFE